MIIRMVQGVRKRGRHKLLNISSISSKRQNLRTEINNTATEINYILKGINSRITEVKEQTSDLEDRVVEITATKQKGMEENKDNLKRLLGQH